MIAITYPAAAVVCLMYFIILTDEDRSWEQKKRNVGAFTRFIFFLSLSVALSSIFYLGILGLFCGFRYETLTAVKLGLACFATFILSYGFSCYTSNIYVKMLSSDLTNVTCIRSIWAILFLNKTNYNIINQETGIALVALRICVASAMVLGTTKTSFFDDGFSLEEGGQGYTEDDALLRQQQQVPLPQ